MSEIDETVPGAGPTTNVSVSFHAGTIGAVRSRVGKRGVSAYIEAAVQRQIERDNLQELVDDHVARHGGFSTEELAAAEAELFGAGEGADARGSAA
ncbi:hypothetical protein H9Y04_28010 [Streptomyces sp. TRM66268-LWL]|uniref:CopG family transcriptional regulator n=1 Tax=Streptomyces polyasparticus TaxID=2767826 RepID=A0ABR7SLM6_9ACTN|nr:hypothetical protein [Streptomyces polyasparticus]MBC9716386.1 hypothetical protein [Streptomyces polyasparticus]